MYVKTASHEVPSSSYNEKNLSTIKLKDTDSTTITTTTTTTTVTTVTTRISSKSQGKESPLYFDADDLSLSRLGLQKNKAADDSKGKDVFFPINPPNTRLQKTTLPVTPDTVVASHPNSSLESSKPIQFQDLQIPQATPSRSETNLPSKKSDFVDLTHPRRHLKRTESAPNIPVSSITGEEKEEEEEEDNNNRNATPSTNIQGHDDIRRHTLLVNESYTETPQQYLERIQDTLSKSELATLLTKNRDVFHEAVLRTYMDSFDFHENPIDIALRKFLMDCYLPKETQQIDRVMEAFAKRYHECNPDLYPSQDIPHILAFSMLILHTDAFNKNVKRKMTKDEFIKNSRTDGVPTEILEILYDNITYTQFIYAEDDTDVNGLKMLAAPSEYRQSRLFGSFKERKKNIRPKNDPYYVIQNNVKVTGFTPSLRDIVPVENPYSYKGTLSELDTHYLHRTFTTAHTIRITGVRARNSNGETLQPTNSSIHSLVEEEEKEKGGTFLLKITKAGRLYRKVDLIEGGKKASGSLRNWKQFGVILSGSQLMFFKNISWFNSQMSEFLDPLKSTKIPVLTPDVILMTSDSIAVYDKSYTRYQNVFRLVCPKGHQYLFEAENEKEMNDWIIKVNYAAAFKTVGVKMRNLRRPSFVDKEHRRSEKSRNRGRRPYINLFEKSEDPGVSDGAGRPDVLRSKIEDLQGKIATLTSQLDADARSIKNLAIMIPYKATTRDRIIQVAAGIGKRFKHTCLELTRLVCYHEIMEKDLCNTIMEERDYWSRRKSTIKSGYDRKYKNHARDVRSDDESRNGRKNIMSEYTLDQTHSPDSSITYSILVTPADTPSESDTQLPSGFDFDINDDLFRFHSKKSGTNSTNEETKDNFRDDVSSFVEIGFDEGKDVENEAVSEGSEITLRKKSEESGNRSSMDNTETHLENIKLEDESHDKIEHQDCLGRDEEEEDSVEEFVDAEEGDD